MHSANQPPPARLQLSRAKRSILQITKFTLQSNYSGLPCGQRLVSGYEILMSQLRAGLHWRHGCHHPAEGCHTSPPPPCDLVSLARCRRGCVPSNDPGEDVHSLHCNRIDCLHHLSRSITTRVRGGSPTTTPHMEAILEHVWNGDRLSHFCQLV